MAKAFSRGTIFLLLACSLVLVGVRGEASLLAQL